jgi:hypothetical protein
MMMLATIDFSLTRRLSHHVVLYYDSDGHGRVATAGGIQEALNVCSRLSVSNGTVNKTCLLAERLRVCSLTS